jgi:hypothetical protein
VKKVNMKRDEKFNATTWGYNTTTDLNVLLSAGKRSQSFFVLKVRMYGHRYAVLFTAAGSLRF